MSITKTKKHKLSLDPTKPNKKSGCTVATLQNTNEVLNIELANPNHSTSSSLSLGTPRLYVELQNAKRALMHEMEGYVCPKARN
jgi:hypothetical protein